MQGEDTTTTEHLEISSQTMAAATGMKLMTHDK
jgi:hypothetical protein